MTSNSNNKKSSSTRRFSLIRLFNNNNSNRNSMLPAPYRHSMDPSSMNSMETDMMCERRKSIATMTESPFRSMSLDFRPSAIRPVVQNKKAPRTEMNEKMRQFDELLQTRCSGTIRISLTPILLQEPY
ncbi:hypothetical protein BGZ65_000053 [Modicella reniformis]|uniref:Uncharacterized protein n=1 Tax=Modicella reniformis TaxID=1440133 RepID=A0A9P6IQ17_9FUNG|nr:hypothetical protein BGZ65_000053 [Modicella reniformis]